MSHDPASEALQRLRTSEAARRLQQKRERERAERDKVWFVSPDGVAARGPMTAAKLLQEYLEGNLPPDSLVWRDGLDDWQVVQDADGLKAALGLVPAEDKRWSEDDHGGEMSMRIDLPPPEPEEIEDDAAPARDRTRVRVGASRVAPGAATRVAAPGSELALIEEVSAQVSAYMDELVMRAAGELAALDADQQRQYLAFELGVLEYYRQALLPEAFGSEAELEQGFFSLLVHHAGQHYPGSAEEVITFWHSLLTEEGLTDIREIGFDSVRDGLDADGSTRRGHYAADYLRRALGLPVED